MIGTFPETKRARFTERTNSQGRVNRATGVISGVKFLGRFSRNGREYTERAMRDAVPLYDGKRIYIGHPKNSELNEDRSYHDWIAVSRNPRFREGGIYGDIECRMKSPHYEGFIEATEKFDGCIGMSHVADGNHRMSGGKEIIESISEVFSIDVVMDAATTAGLFEAIAPTLPDTADEQFGNAVDELRAIGGYDELADKLAGLGEDIGMLAKSFEVNAPVQESYQPISSEYGCESFASFVGLRPPSPDKVHSFVKRCGK